MIFVDTNYFLRFLLRDNSLQFEEAKKLFVEAAQGKIELVTSVIVIFEIYWVLSSFYMQSKKDIVQALKKILQLSFITIENKQILEKSTDLYLVTNISLEDCYNLAFIKEHGIEKFLTFDEKLSKVYHKSLV